MYPASVLGDESRPVCGRCGSSCVACLLETGVPAAACGLRHKQTPQATKSRVSLARGAVSRRAASTIVCYELLRRHTVNVPCRRQPRRLRAIYVDPGEGRASTDDDHSPHVACRLSHIGCSIHISPPAPRNSSRATHPGCDGAFRSTHLHTTTISSNSSLYRKRKARCSSATPTAVGIYILLGCVVTFLISALADRSRGFSSCSSVSW